MQVIRKISRTDKIHQMCFHSSACWLWMSTHTRQDWQTVGVASMRSSSAFKSINEPLLIHFGLYNLQPVDTWSGSASYFSVVEVKLNMILFWYSLLYFESHWVLYGVFHSKLPVLLNLHSGKLIHPGCISAVSCWSRDAAEPQWSWHSVSLHINSKGNLSNPVLWHLEMHLVYFSCYTSPELYLLWVWCLHSCCVDTTDHNLR